jgi:hypothetical protein
MPAVNGLIFDRAMRSSQQRAAQSKAIRILSVEDHPIFREGLVVLIESAPDMVLVGQAANGIEAIAEFRRQRPDGRSWTCAFQARTGRIS